MGTTSLGLPSMPAHCHYATSLGLPQHAGPLPLCCLNFLRALLGFILDLRLDLTIFWNLTTGLRIFWNSTTGLGIFWNFASGLRIFWNFATSCQCVKRSHFFRSAAPLPLLLQKKEWHSHIAPLEKKEWHSLIALLSLFFCNFFKDFFSH